MERLDRLDRLNRLHIIRSFLSFFCFALLPYRYFQVNSWTGGHKRARPGRVEPLDLQAGGSPALHAHHLHVGAAGVENHVELLRRRSDGHRADKVTLLAENMEELNQLNNRVKLSKLIKLTK